MKLIQNVGTTDRILRLTLAVIILIFGFVTGSWLGLIGIVPLATAITGTCPVYMPFGYSTAPQE